MESQTYIKNIDISSKKLRFLVSEIKKINPSQALHHLYYMPKRAARILYKAIQSALHNARLTLKVNENMLQFKVLTIEEGYILKRYRAGGKGTAKPFVKRRSHIKIVLVAAPSSPPSRILKPTVVVDKKEKDSVVKEDKKTVNATGKTKTKRASRRKTSTVSAKSRFSR